MESVCDMVVVASVWCYTYIAFLSYVYLIRISPSDTLLITACKDNIKTTAELFSAFLEAQSALRHMMIPLWKGILFVM